MSCRSTCLTLALAALVTACASDRIGSIGAVLSRDNDTAALYVRDLSTGRGGERSGLVPGDEIVMIDGYYVRDMDPARVRKLLRGDVGTFVDLTVVRGKLVLRMHVERTALLDPARETKPRVETMAE